jgi:DNA-binding CsgD family transcriptional regulator
VRVPPRAVLTARELDVLGLVGAGHTTREVSEALGISPKTVENHKQRIFVKLGVQNQAHAVAVAMRTGLLHADAGLRASGR